MAAQNGFLLQLTDGTSTIDFMVGDYAVMDGGLVISPPEQVQTWTDPTQTNGPMLVDSRSGNRTVTINFSISNGSRPVIRQDINLVNDILRKAIEHSLGLTKTRVTLKYAWDQAASVDNFEVLSGQLTMPENVLSVEQMHGKINDKYCVDNIQLALVVSPVAYGLSPSTDALIEIPLTNRNGTRVLGGIPVTDWVDTGQVSRRVITGNKAGGGTEVINFWNDNYVELAAQDIVGDAPGKFLIEIRDPLCTNKMDRVIIGAGEKVTGQLQWYWKDSGMAFMAGGQEYTIYLNHFLGQSIWRFAGGPVNGLGNAIWSITINDPSIYANKRYRVLWVGGNAPPSNDYFKPDFPVKLVIRALNGANTPTIWQGTPTTIKASQNGWALTWDLGVVTLPPYSEMMQNPGPIQLVAYPAGTEAQTTDFLFYGYVLLLPVDQGYRVLSAPSGGAMVNGVGGYPMMPGTNQNNYLVDDGWSEVTYIRQDNGKTFGYVQAQYAPLSLGPNKTHRIYFHFMGNQLYPSDQDMYMVRVYYAPAYLGGL